MIYGGVVAVELIVSVVAIVCVTEYVAMAFPGGPPQRESRWGGGGGGQGGVLSVHAAAVYAGPGEALAVVGFVAVAALLHAETFFPGPSLDGAADRAGRLVLGVAWIGLLTFLVFIRRADHGVAWIFLVLVASWLGDTGGYFAGRFFGQAPAVSEGEPEEDLGRAPWAGLHSLLWAPSS